MESMLSGIQALVSISNLVQGDSSFVRLQVSSAHKSIEILRKMIVNQQIDLNRDIGIVCLVIGRAHGRIDAAWEYDASINKRCKSDLADVAINGFYVDVSSGSGNDVDPDKLIAQLKVIENTLSRLIDELRIKCSY